MQNLVFYKCLGNESVAGMLTVGLTVLQFKEYLIKSLRMKSVLIRSLSKNVVKNRWITRAFSFGVRMPQQTYVYLIKDNYTGFTKIGISQNPEKRLSELCYQRTLLPTPHDFEIIIAWEGCREGEQDLHNHFRSKRVRGEWFDLDEKDIASIFYIYHGAKQYHFTMRRHCEKGLNKQDTRTLKDLMGFIWGEDFIAKYYGN